MDKRPYSKARAVERFSILLIYIALNVAIFNIHWHQALLFAILTALEGAGAIRMHVRHHVEDANYVPINIWPVKFYRRLISSDRRMTITLGVFAAATAIAAAATLEVEMGEIGGANVHAPSPSVQAPRPSPAHDAPQPPLSASSAASVAQAAKDQSASGQAAVAASAASQVKH